MNLFKKLKIALGVNDDTVQRLVEEDRREFVEEGGTNGQISPLSHIWSSVPSPAPTSSRHCLKA